MRFLWILLGYLSGSVLYARVSAKAMNVEDFPEKCPDQNPGTANAFQHMGVAGGVFTLLGDLLKGFVPVWMYGRYCRWGDPSVFWGAVVLAAPVLGHAFPVFYGFRGGKGIATTFGCLLGLYPNWNPLFLLAGSFLFYSLVVQIRPDSAKTAAAYLTTALGLAFVPVSCQAQIGFLLMSAAVDYRLYTSPEHRERTEMVLLWKR